jgi:hypothetical protein
MSAEQNIALVRRYFAECGESAGGNPADDGGPGAGYGVVAAAPPPY